MSNERLRAALLERGLTPAELAEAIGVDPKSVERWITLGRTPYRRHRYAVGAHLGMEETYLWPKALSNEQSAAASESEIVEIHAHRWAVPQDTWQRLFESAEREIGILVYSGFFLADNPGVVKLLADKARAGVRVRVLLGDPDSAAVAQRGEDEGIGDSMAAKIRNVIVLYAPLRAVEGTEFRLHGTVLYNSLYRADGQLLVNTHVYGAPAANAPVFHLRKIPGGDMMNTYLESFEQVWSNATPLD
ncbi:transcriptional regulator with XRE-family HTH domain [Nocardiopsis mwathae]|uniref:Transcriptional regulator with XRE-family HTH domain n=1 Tax=Nocardiopsis mwathae TaxID=1472723 RepID=A0A7W9YM66_9ACTN|nr:XRE family transcriptional regulator [Nocardiopsis mwathae]MBB6174699.1 transcriptional regulator with XRE-family HTH domain [Nocardiopsis mwathae]